MSKLNEIKASPKAGSENLTEEGQIIEYNLSDFWKWSVSDLLSNATRGRFAEFIVGTAVGLDPKNLRNEWDAFDLVTKSGIKIEVKSAAYIQSWAQKKYSNITFSIKSAIDIEAKGKLIPKRHADVYVFCHLKHKDQETIDPLKMEQWDFYVVATSLLDKHHKGQKTISLTPLKKLTDSINYGKLQKSITDKFKM